MENVAIYGIAEEYPLKDVFTRIYNKESGGPAISHKESSEKLREYMEEILPEYDESRVYNSDLKIIPMVQPSTKQRFDNSSSRKF